MREFSFRNDFQIYVGVISFNHPTIATQQPLSSAVSRFRETPRGAAISSHRRMIAARSADVARSRLFRSQHAQLACMSCTQVRPDSPVSDSQKQDSELSGCNCAGLRRGNGLGRMLDRADREHPTSGGAAPDSACGGRRVGQESGDRAGRSRPPWKSRSRSAATRKPCALLPAESAFDERALE